jgi:hypothetical protein
VIAGVVAIVEVLAMAATIVLLCEKKEPKEKRS